MIAKYASKFGIAIAFFCAGAFAQVNDEQIADEEEVIDEIIVTAGDKPGDPVDVDALYEDMMRDMLMTDLDRLNELEDQQKWRAATDQSVETSSRISWGYDPHEERQMRSDLDISDARGTPTRPATVFRFGF